MNIVKLKDKMIEITTESPTWAELFNTKFRGQYVIAIKWKKCIPMEYGDAMIPYTQNDIFKMSRDEMTITGSIDFDDLNTAGLIDFAETERANDFAKYITFNHFIPSEITAEQVKKFRWWLADTILEDFEILITDDETEHMIKYYQANMNDDTIKILTKFGGETIKQVSTTLDCGCTKMTIPEYNVATCNTIAIYRRNIYTKMVEVFGKMDFWSKFDADFLEMFKLYIDNIIKMNLQLVPTSWIDEIAKCSCNISADTRQQMAIEKLKRLSEALRMMIAEKRDGTSLAGNTTYINTAFNDWATYLYEQMQWT